LVQRKQNTHPPNIITYLSLEVAAYLPYFLAAIPGSGEERALRWEQGSEKWLAISRW